MDRRLEGDQTERLAGGGREEQDVGHLEVPEGLRVGQLPVEPDPPGQPEPRHLGLQAEALRARAEDVEGDIRVPLVTEAGDRLHGEVRPLVPGQLANGEAAQRTLAVIPGVPPLRTGSGEPVGHDGHPAAQVAAAGGDLVEEALTGSDP